MRRHWSDSHGTSDLPDSFARSTNLQTFFGGTKLRHFEVASPRATAFRALVDSDGSDVQRPGPNLVATPTPRAQTRVIPPASPCDVDPETLRYFHYFTTKTSLTLPAKNRETTNNRQVDVVEQALRVRWLMCGLLAISASHLAALSSDETTTRVDRELSAQSLQDFSCGRGEVRRDPGVAEVEEAKAVAQMICIQRIVATGR
jgi:hypothetical protein